MKNITIQKRTSAICIGLLALLWATTTATAEDVDVYRAFIKNNAMMVIDVSGSMSWAVYDENINYAGFMKWMVDENLAYDENNGRNGSSWWDKNASGDDYDRLDPDQIYLVSTYVDYKVVNYEDSGGVARSISVIDDVMWNTGSETGTANNKRQPFLVNAIIPVKSSANVNWNVTDLNTIEKDGDGYVLFPTGSLQDEDGSAVTTPAAIKGLVLPNYRSILATNVEVDPNTSESIDKGFLGALKATGFYFSGLFEKTGATLEFTNSTGSAETNNGYRVYVFATGNWINFLKLVEDFHVNSAFDSCTVSGTYSVDRYKAWRNICYKEGITESWITGSQTITSHTPEYWCDRDSVSCSSGTYDYPDTPTGNFERGTINPPGTVLRMKIKFDYIDTDGCNSGTANDYVNIQDLAGNSLLCIKGQQIKAGSAGSGAAVSYNGGTTWSNTSPLDSQGYTQALDTAAVKIVWHNGTGNGCSGYDRGFKVSGYKYTDQAPTVSGDFTCCNGDDGVGVKMKSRLQVAQGAMKRVVEETQDAIDWGLTRFDGSSGGTVLSTLGTDPGDVMTQIAGLSAGGGTPLGGAVQDAYNSDKIYLDAHSSLAACSHNYIVLMTDGFPSGDSSWSRINDSDAASYPNPTFVTCSSGYGGCSNYGDADAWPDSNHGDDVAHWLYHKASQRHSVHTIGFGLDNPMLGDMADSSDGVYVTAYSEQQVINAFYSLGLAMSSSVSFTAPVVSVDQANRTQSGDSLYMAFFRPEEGESWRGNLKKYGLQWMDRSDCGRPDPEWVVIDKNGNNATECEGQFKANSVSQWSTVPDGGDVSAGGVGSVLMAEFSGISVASGPYYDFRNIYTCKNPSVSTDIVRFYRDGNAGLADTITKEDLGVANNNLRDKIINYLYGYTFTASDSDGDLGTYSEATDGRPLGKREWILGDMIHSEPLVIDYFDENYSIQRRLIVIGANDGMLHVFIDDADPTTTADTTIGGVAYPPGSEVWAFIPGDILGGLKNFADPSVHRYFMDGSAVVHRARTFDDINGDGIMDPGEYTQQTLIFGERRGGRSYWALDVTDPDPANWTVKWQIQGGVGGDFDELGYSWSKPTVAKIQTGASIKNTTDVVIFGGGYDNQEDNYPEPWADDNGNGVYNSATESYTDTNLNGSYDYSNPTMNSKGRAIFVANLSDGSLRFKVNYDAADLLTGTSQTDNDMKFCFPADPTVIEANLGVLVYITDIYGTIWKVSYDYFRATQWMVNRVFSSNPGSNQPKAVTGISTTPALNASDKGRKAFYSPDVSYYGNDWTDYPVLFYGTGDREHPRYIPSYHNRFYAVADTGTLANETDLLNTTCDELDLYADVDLNGSLNATDNTLKEQLYDIMYGDTDYPSAGKTARGWYKVMGLTGACSQDGTSHAAEMVLSAPTLFFKNIFFTTYQPVFGDPCNPNGNARIYGLEYSFGKTAMNMDRIHDPVIDGTDAKNVQDTYTMIENSSIPSGVRIVTREGHAAAFVSAGGSIVGAGEPGDDPDAEGASSNIPGPPGGAQQIIWETY